MEDDCDSFGVGMNERSEEVNVYVLRLGCMMIFRVPHFIYGIVFVCGRIICEVSS